MNYKARRKSITGIRRRNPNGLALLRRRLGLSQQELADYLEISRSLVLMAESNKRSLPTDVLVKIATLERSLAEKQSLKQEFRQPHASEVLLPAAGNRFLAAMLDREARCRLESHALGINLDRMIARYSQAREWLQLLEANILGNAETAARPSSWEYQYQTAIKKLSSCSLAEQMLLRNKIALYDAEADLNNRLHKQFTEELPIKFHNQ